MQLLDFLGGVAELLFLGAVDDVVIFVAAQRLVGGDDGDVEFIDFLELGGFRVGRAGHAGQLLIHAEIVLEGDGGQGLIFALDFYAFLGLDGLVQTVGPAAAGHQAAGVLIDDDDFVVFDHVIAIAQDTARGRAEPAARGG